MHHEAYFSPRAAQGAEREISRTLKHLSCFPVTMRRIAEERAMADPAGNNLFIHIRQVSASLAVCNSGQCSVFVRTFETGLLVHLMRSKE